MQQKELDSSVSGGRSFRTAISAMVPGLCLSIWRPPECGVGRAMSFPLGNSYTGRMGFRLGAVSQCLQLFLLRESIQGKADNNLNAFILFGFA